jgi:enamine deaminase RidA (YjgF/YER057c/UK114 family)
VTQHQRIPSPSLYAPTIGFSAAVRGGDTVWVAGMSAVNADGNLVGGADPYLQAQEVLRKVVAALEEAGAGVDDVVMTRMYIVDAGHWEAVGRAHGEVFAAARPAASMLVTRLLDERMLVEIEAMARLSEAPGSDR